MKKIGIKGVIFDVDGTLIDSIDLFYDISCEVMRMAGLPPAPRERVLELMRLGDTSPLESLFPPDYPDVRGAVRAIVEQRAGEWLQRYNNEVEAIPGCLEVLGWLHSQGFLLGIATSSGRDLPFLKRWGVYHLFTSIVGREDVKAHKPEPDAVVCCLEKLHIPSRSALFVGDSPIDIRAGKAAGVYTVGVLSGVSRYEILLPEKPECILPSVVELPAVLSPAFFSVAEVP